MKSDRYCLLVEDDPEDQEYFLRLFDEVCEDIGCYAVSNGEEALTALAELKIIPEVIFTDLNMPKVDGFTFIKQLRSMKQFKHVEVVVYTAHFTESEIEKAKELRVRAIYSKTKLEALNAILKRHLPKIIA